MPELPDVDGFRRYLARHAAGERINAVDVLDPVMIRNRSPRAFSRSLEGKRFAGPDRHGKWLIAPVDGIEVLFHFGMTGLFRWSESGRERHPHDRVIFVCEQGELRYNNMRRFGGIWLAGDPQERDAVTGPLGPDALDLDEDAFNSLIGARRGGIKAALMDQRLIAGAGNLLSDEILWRARSSLHAGGGAELAQAEPALPRSPRNGERIDPVRPSAARRALADAGARRAPAQVPALHRPVTARDDRRPHRGLVPSLPAEIEGAPFSPTNPPTATSARPNCLNDVRPAAQGRFRPAGEDLSGRPRRAGPTPRRRPGHTPRPSQAAP